MNVGVLASGAGTNLQAILDRVHGREGVTVTGAVPDVRPHLERAAVFAAPLRFGAGIQNKVLEAMAMETPVVASPLAAGGLRVDGGPEAPVTVAATVDELAARVVDRIHAVRHDPSPDRDGRMYVSRHFVWAASAERLEEALTAAVRRRAARESLAPC